MPRSKSKKNGANSAAPMTTSQMLGSLLKSARDIMRKDKGLNGDLDRLPLLTWIMFLKFLDDLEQQRKEEAALAGKKFKGVIEAPYRWRDWATDPQGITGDELLAFINNDEAVRADGKKGAGLFAYLRSLTSSNGDNRRVTHFAEHGFVKRAQSVQFIGRCEMDVGDFVDDVAQEITAFHTVIDALEHGGDNIAAVVAVGTRERT